MTKTRISIPDLRFKDEQRNDYSDWEERRIQDICEINPTYDDLPNTFTYIDLESVEKGKLIKQNEISKDNAPSRAQRVVKKADVLFQTVRPYQKNNFYFNLSGNYVASTGYAQLRASSSAYFLFCLLHVQKMVDKVMARCTGTSYPAINSNDLGTIRVFVPTKPEQQKIASFLSSVDTKIEQLGKKKALLEQYKKGMMQKLFSQEISFKDERGKDYPDWEESCIHDICEINPTSGSLPNTFYYIDLESVHKGIFVNQSEVMKINAPSRAQRLLRKQDVLFQTVRPYQKNNYYFELDGDYVASTGYAQLRAKASSRFLFYLLHVQNIVNTMISRCTGTSYPAINSNDLGTIKVLVPAKNEQQKIANFLSAIDKKIELVTEQLEQARTFKKGLLQQMFI